MDDGVMRDGLMAYEAAYRSEWRVRDEKHAATELMEAACAKERRELNRKVRAILKQARPGWWLLRKADVRVVVNHAVRPLTCALHVTVTLGYSASMRRGDLQMTCMWTEREAMLAELAALIGGVA